MELDGDFTVQVFDANGKLVMAARNKNVLSFKGLKAGMYHIAVEQNGQHWSRKVIKM